MKLKPYDDDQICLALFHGTWGVKHHEFRMTPPWSNPNNTDPRLHGSHNNGIQNM